MKPLKELTRPNIWALKPYSSARDEYSGKEASVFLDANENPYNTPNNRYPDPLQRELKGLIGRIKKVSPEHIFLGNGSDEAIDLPFRAFCRPGIDNVVAIEPTYGMYQVCADVNDVEYRKVQLDANFQFKAADLLAAAEKISALGSDICGCRRAHQTDFPLLAQQPDGQQPVPGRDSDPAPAVRRTGHRGRGVCGFLRPAVVPVTARRVPEPDYPANLLKSVGLCGHPSGHGVRLQGNHRPAEQNQISLQCEPTDTAGSHPDD